MLRSLSPRGRYAPSLFAALLAWLTLALPALGAKPKSETVDLFPAIERGEIEVSISARNARRLTMRIENKTDRPLTIRTPLAMAAAPILAQLNGGGDGDRFGFGNGQGNRGGQGNGQGGGGGRQAMGFGSGQGNGQGQGNRRGGQGIFGNQQGGLFNIPPGKTVKRRYDCVCLQYGKKEPVAHIAYQVQPLATICDEPELAGILSLLGQDRCGQSAAQAAAWRLTDGLSWSKLASLEQRPINGIARPIFSIAEIRTARRLSEFVKSRLPKEEAKPSLGSISQLAP